MLSSNGSLVTQPKSGMMVYENGDLANEHNACLAVRDERGYQF